MDKVPGKRTRGPAGGRSVGVGQRPRDAAALDTGQATGRRGRSWASGSRSDCEQRRGGSSDARIRDLDPEGLDLILALPPTSQSQRPPSARPATEHAGRRGGAEALRRGPGRCGAGRLALATLVLPGRAGSGPAARSPPRPCLRRTETPRASPRCTWPPASDTRCWWSGCCERATQPRWRRWRGPCRCTTPPSAGT